MHRAAMGQSSRTDCAVLDLLLTITGKISVTIETHLYVLGLFERDSELTTEMQTSLRPIPKEDSSSLTFL